MRPDVHKRRASRRYQTRHKAAGDSIAADVAQSRRTTRGRGRGGGGGVRRGGGAEGENAEEDEEDEEEEEEEEEEEKIQSGRRTTAPTSPAARRGGSSFSRRKLTSNIHRYDEPSAEDELAAEAESGVDRQMADFIDLLKNEDDTQSAYDPSTYFQFKEEKSWDGGEDGEMDELYASLMQIRFDELEASLATVPLDLRLGIEKRDLVMIEDPSAFGAATSVPIVPKLLRSEVLIVKPSGTVPAATTVATVASAIKAAVPVPKRGDDDEDLDELLALANNDKLPAAKSSPAHKPTSGRSVPRVTARPGAASTASRGGGEDDFDRFLDEIDGGTGAKASLAKQAKPRGNPKLPQSGRPVPGAPVAAKGGKDGEDWLDDMLDGV